VSRAFALPSSALVAFLLCTDLGWSQALSTSSQPQESSPIESVVISAQKHGNAEDAQSVPLSLTTLNAVDIQQRHALDLHDLTTAAPNVTLTDAGGTPGFAIMTIRGLGVNTTIPSMEPAVGVFVDGIYLGISAGSVLDLIDIENVEILRGPQGLLFGRNTTGGAILINTRRPGDAFAAYGSVRYETGPQEITTASIEGPLGTQFRAKLTGYYNNDDGWFTNQFDGKSFPASRTYVVRPTVAWTPGHGFDSTLIYERGSQRGDGAVTQNSADFQGFDISLNGPEHNRLNRESVTLESNWRTANGIFTNLAGYRTFDQDVSTDNDGSPISGFLLVTRTKQHQFSDELRYFGRVFDQLDITAGLYYFTQSFFYLERRVLAGGAIDSTLGGNVDDINYATFAQADYHVTPALTLTAGGRFTREEKAVQIATFVASTAGSHCNFAAETCVYNFPGSSFIGSPGKDTWDNFTPKLGFQWQADDEVLAYGHWARGVRSGGYNVRNTSTSVPPGPYDPELQDAFELGVKSSWYENRLHANGALFYDKIMKMQREVNQTDPVVASVQVTRNTADATIMGFELELAGAVTGELVLRANAGYTDGRYDKIFYDLDSGGIGPSDYHLAIPRLVRWSYALGATYTHNFPQEFVLQLRGDYGYRSRAASTDDNAAFLPQLEDLSASASLTLPGQHWTLSLYGRNLLDRVTLGVHTPLPAFLGGRTIRTLNEGRVIGVEATFTY
jgi:iron complex outermembrane receptor protein